MLEIQDPSTPGIFLSSILLGHRLCGKHTIGGSCPNRSTPEASGQGRAVQNSVAKNGFIRRSVAQTLRSRFFFKACLQCPMIDEKKNRLPR